MSAPAAGTFSDEDQFEFENETGNLSDSNLWRFHRRISRERTVRLQKERQRRKDELKLYNVLKYKALSKVRSQTGARQNSLTSLLNFVLNKIKSREKVVIGAQTNLRALRQARFPLRYRSRTNRDHRSL